MEPLTSKQRRVWEYLQEVVNQRNYPPSVREICRAMGFQSSSTAHAYLRILEKKGYIRRDSTKPRAIKLMVSDITPPDDEDNITQKNQTGIIFIPVVGEVTAGEPVLAEQNIEEYFPLPRHYAAGEEPFMLKVKGDSMVEAGIKHDDLVLVNPSNGINNGDIVVALLEDEATVKRFYREENRVRLQPENQKYSPTYHREVQVLGKVTGLFRTL